MSIRLMISQKDKDFSRLQILAIKIFHLDCKHGERISQEYFMKQY